MTSSEAAPPPAAGPASPSRRLRLSFAGLFAGLLAFQGHALFLQPHGVPSTASRDTRWVGEVAGAVAVRQSFRLEADGFEAVTLHPRATGGVPAGHVVIELSEITPGSEQDVPVYRVSKPAADLVAATSWTWRFNPIDDSRGKLYAVQVSLPATEFGHGLDLLATRDEEYLGGRLWFDGREQWGDLVFEAHASRATAFRRLEHALAGRPAWLRARFTLATGFLFYNLALAWVLWVALRGAGETRSPAAGGRAWWVPWGALAALVLVAAWWLVPLVAWRERGAVSLVERFPEAVKRTSMAHLQDAFHYDTIAWDGRRMHCITALPTSRIVWTVEVTPGTELRVWAGMRPDVWEGPGDGAEFRVGVGDGQTYEEKFKRWFVPVDYVQDRRFADVHVDLAKYAGRRVELVFNTGPGPRDHAVGDAAAWCEPRIVRR